MLYNDRVVFDRQEHEGQMLAVADWVNDHPEPSITKRGERVLMADYDSDKRVAQSGSAVLYEERQVQEYEWSSLSEQNRVNALLRQLSGRTYPDAACLPAFDNMCQRYFDGMKRTFEEYDWGSTLDNPSHYFNFPVEGKDWPDSKVEVYQRNL
jgi:hypothetical protein